MVESRTLETGCLGHQVSAPLSANPLLWVSCVGLCPAVFGPQWQHFHVLCSALSPSPISSKPLPLEALHSLAAWRMISNFLPPKLTLCVVPILCSVLPLACPMEEASCVPSLGSLPALPSSRPFLHPPPPCFVLTLFHPPGNTFTLLPHIPSTQQAPCLTSTLSLRPSSPVTPTSPPTRSPTYLHPCPALQTPLPLAPSHHLGHGELPFPPELSAFLPGCSSDPSCFHSVCSSLFWVQQPRAYPHVPLWPGPSPGLHSPVAGCPRHSCSGEGRV